jgi:hypothetical protein
MDLPSTPFNRIAHFLAPPAQVNLEEIDKAGWIVCPMESPGHIDSVTAEHLQAVFAKDGSQVFTALPLEPGTTETREFPASEEGLTAFDKIFFPFNCIIFTKGDWFVLFTTDDYYLVAGQPEYVSLFAPDIAEAKKHFRDYAADPVFHGDLSKIVEKYAAE